MIDFIGNINQDVIKDLSNIYKNNIKNYNLDKSYNKNVYNIFIEIIENIYKHSLDRYCQIKLYKEIDFIIETKNKISDENCNILMDKLNILSKLSDDDLKTEYQHILKNGKISDKGGAGLGFIDIFRKSKNTTYSLLDNYLYLKVFV